MEPITIKLQKPIQHGKELISEMTFSRAPEMGDMRSLPADPQQHTVGAYMDIIGDLVGYPPSVISQLQFKDFNALKEVFLGFL